MSLWGFWGAYFHSKQNSRCCREDAALKRFGIPDTRGAQPSVAQRDPLIHKTQSPKGFPKTYFPAQVCNVNLEPCLATCTPWVSYLEWGGGRSWNFVIRSARSDRSVGLEVNLYSLMTVNMRGVFERGCSDHIGFVKDLRTRFGGSMNQVPWEVFRKNSLAFWGTSWGSPRSYKTRACQYCSNCTAGSMQGEKDTEHHNSQPPNTKPPTPATLYQILPSWYILVYWEYPILGLGGVKYQA